MGRGVRMKEGGAGYAATRKLGGGGTRAMTAQVAREPSGRGQRARKGGEEGGEVEEGVEEVTAT